MSVLPSIAIIFGALFAAIVIRAWVLTVMWAWFLVPFGVFELTIPAAMGISLIVGMFTSHLTHDLSIKVKTEGKTDVSTALGKLVGHGIINPLIVLSMGWVVTWFM